MKVSGKKDLILGVLSIIFAAFIFCTSLGMPGTEYEGDPGPRLLPMCGSVLMAAFGIALVVHPEDDGEALMTPQQWKSAFSLFLVYLLMALLLWLVGFKVMMPIILFITTLMLSKLSAKNATLKRRIVMSLVFSVIASAAIYLLYIVALGASLPKGIVWTLLK